MNVKRTLPVKTSTRRTIKTTEHYTVHGNGAHVLLVEWECTKCGAKGLDENVCMDVEPGFCSIMRCPKCDPMPPLTISDPWAGMRADALAEAKARL